MKKLLCIIAVLFCNSVFASLPDIVALVNDKPITKYDFLSRKNMVILLNNIDVSDASLDAKLNTSILNLLIEEELLNQHAENVEIEVDPEQIKDTIRDLEKKHNMPDGGMRTYLSERGIPLEAFMTQIKSEIIKHNIIASLSNNVSVSPSELNVAIINTAKPEFNVAAWIFTSKSTDAKDLGQMQDLTKRLYDCNKVDSKLYENFADAEKFDRKLRDMPPSTTSVIHDTKPGSSSSVYKEGGKFKLVFVCKKESTVSSEDLSKLKSFLSNKKMSQKAMKFFKDLKTRADIKIMTAN